MPWTCFMVTETDREARWLRRYRNTFRDRPAAPCPLMPGEHSFHRARARVEDGPFSRHRQIDGTDPPAYYHGSPPIEEYAGDPRWPARCACGYRFDDLEDDWQIATALIYEAENGVRWHDEELPAGAMYDAPYHRPFGHVGPDGLSLSVILPPGRGVLDSWCIDGPSVSGGGWQRAGMPPALTVTPSIKSPHYHGFLGSNGAPPGVLTDCLPDMAPQLAAALAALRS